MDREMDREEFDAVSVRLQRVERRLRMAIVGWMLSVVVLAVLWVGVQQAMSQSQVIQARRFEVLDQSGRRVISLGLDTSGLGGIWLYDSAGNNSVQIGFGGGLPGIWVSDSSGKERMALTYDSDKQPGLWFKDTSERTRLTMGPGTDGEPGIWLYDTAHQTRGWFGMGPDGITHVRLNDPAGKPVWVAP